MIGCSFVVNRKFFGEIGLLDPGMDVYGGENIELGIKALANVNIGSLICNVGAGGPAPAAGAAPAGGPAPSTAAAPAKEKKVEAKKEESEESDDDNSLHYSLDAYIEGCALFHLFGIGSLILSFLAGLGCGDYGFRMTLSRPFISEEIGIDLHQTAKKQSNHIKEIKGENTMGLALTSPGKQSRSIGGGGIALIFHTSDKGRCSTKQQELVVKSLDFSSECGALMGKTVPLSNGASVCPANLTDGRDQRP
ncbi:Putative polypeptide N-acetylgalactosaminyltransferase-like protein 3 [Pteropus alecto]|uniref:Putative polypeptide N-acetylgalactosaminyltransferase-like protein 3 n=1 Tax=Pteropus alecto TaxID=9402 RepID=L5K8L8_PTEAL|nr:Putative polypeptide N-acetylgalactosaminyltransferase-like protein 3 [Pteropus alecto]